MPAKLLTSSPPHSRIWGRSAPRIPRRARTIQRLAQRFIVRNAHVPAAPILLQPRYAMSWMRGPMTRHELRRARDPNGKEEPPPASTQDPIVQTSETKFSGVALDELKARFMRKVYFGS